MSLVSYKDDYLTWLDYYIKQINEDLIGYCIANGYQEWLLSKWLYCKLFNENENVSKQMVKLESNLICKDDWKTKIYQSTYKHSQSLRLLDNHKVKQGIVIGHLKPLEDKPDYI